jgi:DmsE family decaheme c-type cytochrome
VRDHFISGRGLRFAGGLAVVCLCVCGPLGCSDSQVMRQRGDAGDGSDKGPAPTRPTGPNRMLQRPVHMAAWHEKSLPPVSATIPTIAGAEMVNDDDLCMNCHKDFVKYHQASVHRKQSCETCHGPASQHLRTRGKEPGKILSFKQMKPAERSEVCIKCHQNDACAPAQKWRASAHAHSGVSCTDCHKNHYNVPPGTPPTKVADEANLSQSIRPAGEQQPAKDDVDMKAIRAASRALGAARAETCYRCHQTHLEMQKPGHPHQIDGPNHFQCTTCHDPHTNVRKETRAAKCLECHKGHPQWAASKHAQHGVACADCHNPHADRPAIKGGDPAACFKCHDSKIELAQVGHPHQVCGATGMKCATCHDPHGNIREETRAELCLKCHKGHPVMAWTSSIHAHSGVACVDCHNPHPDTDVPDFVDIQHTHIRRPKRMPMSVEEPFACYQCHPRIAAQFELPSHHPVREGKMVCSACHDSHGSNEKNLKEPTVNLTCYRCHGDKTGPFVWEHPPVSENCDICHNPHGTVANNLLKQQPAFLCLRCHAGHRGHHAPIDTNTAFRAPFYTDCSQCHSQIHGTNFPAQSRNGPRLLR